MDKAKQVADDLRKCADILHGLADLLTEDTEASPAAPEKPAETSAETTEAKPAKEQPVTLETVRAVAAKIARAGGTEQVKALIEKHGVNKLSAVPPAEYGALLKELEGIGDGT
ncbi:MAG: rRNA biogenesis protein rrp5 [Selenomonas sp.]|uniref:rRNA biogenesis protein rrp5 n=1 Tax=Selenomonas sp. TaxID=2053611 RepID=UPI0025E595D4|nr:rRNA biogenesis protein rrp5 [Selenomonas sp.]MCI6087148.1 rRNA biogenesis protein rrp5 [Selenomonas sp.]MDY4417465.1 rRNA biogenesis protein rrp5 [Selenomonas sp.]